MTCDDHVCFECSAHECGLDLRIKIRTIELSVLWVWCQVSSAGEGWLREQLIGGSFSGRKTATGALFLKLGNVSI